MPSTLPPPSELVPDQPSHQPAVPPRGPKKRKRVPKLLGAGPMREQAPCVSIDLAAYRAKREAQVRARVSRRLQRALLARMARLGHDEVAAALHEPSDMQALLYVVHGGLGDNSAN